jgi:hypothetical protein
MGWSASQQLRDTTQNPVAGGIDLLGNPLYYPYSTTWEGLGLIVEHMRQNGWTFALDVSLDREWPEAYFHGKQFGAASAETYPRAVAIAAVLAAQGKRKF